MCFAEIRLDLLFAQGLQAPLDLGRDVIAPKAVIGVSEDPRLLLDGKRHRIADLYRPAAGQQKGNGHQGEER